MGTTTKITIVVLAMLALTISVHAQSVPPPLSEKDIENALRAHRKPASAPRTVWQKADAACRDHVQWNLKAPDSAEFKATIMCAGVAMLVATIISARVPASTFYHALRNKFVWRKNPFSV